MKKTKILIVDDYQENIVALSQLIADDRLETHAATSADEALELLSQFDFGLALLDVQMPGTSGFELARLIRSVKKFKSLPIIFVTAHREDSSVIFKGYQNGAIDVLFKPLDPDVVRAKVQMFVELAQQKALLEQQVTELEVLRREAESANLAKSQFLANMSHEIRTPLAAVMGFADLIAQGHATKEEIGEYGLAVHRNGHLLLRLIDDILDLSKIEANKLELEKSPFSLPNLLQDVQSTMAFRASERGVKLNFTSSMQSHKAYLSDAIKIKQVLLNIIGNAIKFSPNGVVGVDVVVTPESAAEKLETKRDLVEIRVEDNGVGFSLDQAKRIFQAFGQADSSTSRKFGGSGLGLIISREIARALGGDIKLVYSEPGKGSVFKVEFYLERIGGPIAAIDPLTTSGVSATSVVLPNPLRARILAVDDSEDNLTLISLFLRGTGVDITYVESGAEALAAIAKEKFDLILMDIQMPQMDGHETTAKIRQQGFKGPIIALTAHALKSEHQKCLSSGCNEVLTKPLSQVALIETVRANLQRFQESVLTPPK